MKCNKADCNFYDSSMEYNCAWGNDGSSSIMCMTHNYKRYCQRPLTTKLGCIKNKCSGDIPSPWIRELLIKYTQYLQDCGYLDDDWWCEEPNSVDRFLSELSSPPEGE